MAGKRRGQSTYNRPKRPRPVTKQSIIEDDGESVLDSITIHPLLRTDGPQNEVNPVKKSDWKESSKGYTLNPYLNQDDMASGTERRPVLSSINEKGKYIEQAKELRERWAEEKEERLRKEALGMKPGEELYEPEQPPNVEWWDKMLVPGGYGEKPSYSEDNDDNPITIYVQHPVPISPVWERNMAAPKPLYLTKKEQKRLRRNDRLIKLQEKQDRIKLGLDPTPAPKIKLKNLMNVLSNKTIRDPTEMEMKVRKEVRQRQLEHERMNSERALSKEEKREKTEAKLEEDRAEGCFSSVFKIMRLVNPKHIYKVDVNAKQLELTGMCLNLKGGMSLVIVEGGQKSVKKYRKLLLRRIAWKENELPRSLAGASQDDLEDLSGNSCRVVWEGELPEPHFIKWTNYTYDTEELLLETLAKYRLENYWQQALTC